MRATCLRMGQLVNQTELGRDVAMAQPTMHRWLNLLVRLPAYAVNRTKRLIKAPKIHWGDTGAALHLAEVDEPGGAHLENLVPHDRSPGAMRASNARSWATGARSSARKWIS